MNQEIKLAQKEDLTHILEQLRKEGVRHAYAIQDLTVWFENSKFFYIQENDKISYVLITGHPAARGGTTLVAEGLPSLVAAILKKIAVKPPFIIRETPGALLSVIQEAYPEAKVYLEQRMDVTKKNFTPQTRGLARNLSVLDAPALAQFFGAPPQAAEGFKGWLSGAKSFFGIFEGERLVSIGSAMVTVPEAWNIVAIETLKEFRGKGYATEIVSSLVERALQETDTVTLTVVKGNAPAIRAYEKVGFEYAEDRIWIDNGANASP